jgi:hypothetical protein
MQFKALRHLVIAGAGFDFLARCGDMLRAKTFESSKPGVIYLSRHKSGDAFDYNQEDSRVLIVREQKRGLIYWRTYLICNKQDGTQGVRAELNTDNVGKVSAFVFDFTAAAEGLGWERIPAREGWRQYPSKKEYWHYEMPEGLSFDQALALVNYKPLGIVERTPETKDGPTAPAPSDSVDGPSDVSRVRYGEDAPGPSVFFLYRDVCAQA